MAAVATTALMAGFSAAIFHSDLTAIFKQLKCSLSHIVLGRIVQVPEAGVTHSVVAGR